MFAGVDLARLETLRRRRWPAARCTGRALAALVTASVAAGGPTTPAAEAAGARGAGASCVRPYSNDSPWNAPIGSVPSLSPTSATHVAAIGGTLSSDPTQYTYPVYGADATTPRRPVRIDGWFSNVEAGGASLTNSRAATVVLPIPDGVVAAAGTDAHLVVHDAATGDEWGLWRFRVGEDGSFSASNGYHYNTTWSGVAPRSESGGVFTARGAGIPLLAGLVRPCEIARGRIEHALAFAYDSPTAAFVYPASKSDGASSDPADLPEGARLQLDPSLDAAALAALGCSGACLVIARALQEYGMIVTDNSGRPKLMLEYQGTAGWAGVDANTVAPIPVGSLRVLDGVQPGALPAAPAPPPPAAGVPGGGPPSKPRRKRSLRIVGVVVSIPRAGTVLEVRLRVRRPDRVAPLLAGRVTCQLALDGRRIESTSASVQAAERGARVRCGWRLPAASAGSVARVVIVVDHPRGSATLRLARTVRRAG